MCVLPVISGLWKNKVDKFSSKQPGKSESLCFPFGVTWTHDGQRYIGGSGGTPDEEEKSKFLSRISFADPDMDSLVELASNLPRSGDAGHIEAAQSVG